MRRTVLVFGLVFGAVSVGLLFVTIPYVEAEDLSKHELLGYAGIVVAALFVFFGVRSYREKSGGRLTFGRGLAVGVLITLVATTCYTATAQVVYFGFKPDLGAHHAAGMVERARQRGADAEQIEQTRRQAEEIQRLMDNPMTNLLLAWAFSPTFAVGLLSSLASAAILRRKESAGANQADKRNGG
jgi:hypothetical protein